MVYTKDAFDPMGPKEEDPEIKGVFSAYMGTVPSIIIYQCTKCGNVKLSNGVLEKICPDP